MLWKTLRRKNLRFACDLGIWTPTSRLWNSRSGYRRVNKRHREWQEEQGLNVLFIALGFLRWIDEDEEPACSPILLVPCDMTHASPRDPFLLVRDESDDLGRQSDASSQAVDR